LYCFIHTNLRAILIADVDGVGLGTMWSTPEAKAVLRLVQQHPNVFTRTVCDTLHGLGKIGYGSLYAGPWPAALRCVFPGFPSYNAYEAFKPRLTGALLEMTETTAKAFAKLLRNFWR
jgi:hypothetical protein